MDAVAELVEQSHDLVVLQEGRLLLCGLAEVADKGSGGVPSRAVGLQEARRQAEVGRVAILARAGMQVEVQVADEAVALASVIPHAEDDDILVPRNVLGLASRRDALAIFGRQLDEDQAKQLLENAEHASDRGLEREVLGDGVLVDAVLLLHHHPVVEAMVPEVVVAIKGQVPGLVVLLLQRQQMINLLDATRGQAGLEVSQEVEDGLGRLGHLVLDAERGVVGVTEKAGSLVAKEDGFLEEGDVLVTLF
jgi:hypothetical protein